MVVVIEQEPEPEEATRPASPVPGEQAAAAAEAGGEAAPPPAPQEQVAGGTSGGAPNSEDEEEAFEDALTDEQLQEVVPRNCPHVLVT